MVRKCKASSRTPHRGQHSASAIVKRLVTEEAGEPICNMYTTLSVTLTERQAKHAAKRRLALFLYMHARRFSVSLPYWVSPNKFGAGADAMDMVQGAVPQPCASIGSCERPKDRLRVAHLLADSMPARLHAGLQITLHPIAVLTLHGPMNHEVFVRTGPRSSTRPASQPSLATGSEQTMAYIMSK